VAQPADPSVKCAAGPGCNDGVGPFVLISGASEPPSWLAKAVKEIDSMRARRTVVAAAIPLTVAAALGGAGSARASAPHVLLVGSFAGVAGDYTSIQAAVNAAQPGDWVLVAPGDYHEQGIPGADEKAGVLITTPGIHLRGMDRNHVVVDGTKAGAPNLDGFGCDSAPSSQQLDSPVDGSGAYTGRNGVEVYEVDGVSVENLTACNFLRNKDGEEGNQVWFNGGDGSGHIGMGAFGGAYLTASSSYNYGSDPANAGSSTVPMGQYGIFTSNERGPAVLAHTYASNMGDSDYYIGACADCNVDVTDAHAENSSLGFSGTNAGGHLVLENSEWDNNKAGIAPNALNNDDWPSPPDGSCPAGTTSPLHLPTCGAIVNNNVHDNNNYNAPSYGIAGSAPPGTGILLSGVQNYTVTGNRIENNKSYGVVVNDFPDTETPPQDAVDAGAACRGGTDLSTPLQELCYYNAFGNEVAANSFTANGTYGNPGNADIAVATMVHNPGNCFHDNTDTSGTLSSDPPQIQTVMGTCGQPNGYLGPSLVQLLCTTPGAVSIGSFIPTCPTTPVTNYPPVTGVTIMAIPHSEATMPNPCAGVPNNPWCTNGSPINAANRGAHHLVAAAVGVSLPNTGAAGGVAAGALALWSVAGLVALGARRRRTR